MFRWTRNYFSQREGNRLVNFLSYAVVEILLVLIGILLAVQIDQKITENRNNSIRCEYLSELLTDLHGQQNAN
ncbi:MAG: hypothetical protein AAFO94_06125 [Bacteroidota bacterium]